MNSTTLYPEFNETSAVTVAEHNQQLAEVNPEYAGGLNANENDRLDSLYSRLMNLERSDYAVPASRLRAEQAGQNIGLTTDNGLQWLSTPYAIGQLSDRLSKGLRSFGDEMISRNNADIYVSTLNELLERDDKQQRFQVRTIQPNGARLARAVVSDKFKPIDDDIIVPPMVDLLADNSKQWRSLGGQITDQRTYLRFISREPAIRNIGPNGRNWFIGFQYSNSEVGQGLCRFDLFFFDSFCENGCVFGQKSILDVNFRHVGARIKTAFGLISDERIQQAEQASIAGLISDATRQVMSADFGDKVRQHLERSQSRRLAGVGDLSETIRQVGKSVGLTSKEQESALLHWDSREDSAFGIANAITRTAQDAKDYSSRVRLESAGGNVLEMSDKKWKSIMALAS